MARRLAVLLYSVAAVAYAADRTSKALVEANLQERPPIEVIPNVFHLVFTTNPGGAFGLFGGASLVFVVASVVVAAVILATSWRVPSAWTAVGLGLILGGALGNLTDRVIRGPGLSGEVVDFIDLRVWPVFNLADSAIVVGAAILLLRSFRKEPEEGREARRA